MRMAIVVAAVIGLAGCQTAADERQTRMDAALTSVRGQTVAAYSLDHGPPASSFDISPGQRAFVWQTSSQSAGAAAVMPGTSMILYRPPRTLTCAITLVATSKRPSSNLGDWVVADFRWSGSC